MPEIKGSCSCGKVTYTADADPIFTGVCHCRSCQKGTGSAFAVVVGLPATSVTLNGAVKTYDSTGDSGKPTHHSFCPECGSQMTGTADVMPGVIMLAVGTMDDPTWVKPAMQIYCDSAQPWVVLGGEMQRFAKMPGQNGA
jgi:hypothetical protein